MSLIVYFSTSIIKYVWQWVPISKGNNYFIFPAVYQGILIFKYGVFWIFEKGKFIIIILEKLAKKWLFPQYIWNVLHQIIVVALKLVYLVQAYCSCTYNEKLPTLRYFKFIDLYEIFDHYKITCISL